MSLTSITVRYFAGAAAAAGRDTEQLAIPAGADLNTMIEHLVRARPSVEDVLERCSFLWDGAAVLDRERVLLPAGEDEDEHSLDVLPPFAGG